jgi:large subunit ribosomal protein L30
MPGDGGRQNRPGGKNAAVKVTQVRSAIGTKRNQRETLRTLGLRKIRQSVVREDSASVRGMIATVRHLVTVEEVDSE